MTCSSGAIVSWCGTSTSIDRQKQALERQTFVADTLQEAFIPKVLPDSTRARFRGAYFAAQVDASVGGDWYGATSASGIRDEVLGGTPSSDDVAILTMRILPA